MSQTIFRVLSVLADRIKFFPPMGMQYASKHGVGGRVMIIMRDSKIFAL